MGGCKYIGVVRNDGLCRGNLNSNLQSGCSGRRIAWDGSCASIYYDIDGHGSTRIGRKYKTDDIVTVNLDTDIRAVTFEHNDKMIRKVIDYKGNYDLQAVIGFGYESGEQYTIHDQ